MGSKINFSRKAALRESGSNSSRGPEWMQPIVIVPAPEVLAPANGLRNSVGSASNMPDQEIKTKQSYPASQKELEALLTTRKKGKVALKWTTQEVAPPSRCQHCDKRFSCKEFSEEHEVGCIDNPITKTKSPDQRDDPGQQDGFMRALFLNPSTKGSTKSYPQETEVQNSPTPVANQERCANFFRSNPVEISSMLGRSMIKSISQHQNGSGKCNLRRLNYCEKYGHLKSYSKSFAVRKLEGYQHIISFSRNQRIVRDIEIVTGLNRKSWKRLNKCKISNVAVTRLPDNVVKQCRLNRLKAQMKACKRLAVRTVDIMTIPAITRKLKAVTSRKPDETEVAHNQNGIAFEPKFDETLELILASALNISKVN